MSAMFHEVGDVVVVELSHALYEGAECDAMESRLLARVRHGARVVVDLSKAQLTAHCMGVLVTAQRVAVEHGTRIVLSGASPMQRALLARMGLAAVLPVFADRELALRRVSEGMRSVA